MEVNSGIYNPSINFCALSLDKAGQVIQIGRWLSEDIHRPIWYPSSDFISTKRANEQTFKLNFGSNGKKIRFAEASDGEMTKLVGNAVPGNTKTSTKYSVNVFELSFVFSIDKLKVN